ncbi:hypothetical protein ACIA5G_39175 [Amycolatopsis sp. NPDC051758]|uniref:hypothetical protein n=1 Tax=Amycolatopsis sp. NPDC051758 TaxID=3363935 RepID=UPI00378F3F4D
MSEYLKHTVTVTANVVLLFSTLAAIMTLIGHWVDHALLARGQRPAPSDTRPEVRTP